MRVPLLTLCSIFSLFSSSAALITTVKVRVGSDGVGLSISWPALEIYCKNEMESTFADILDFIVPHQALLGSHKQLI